jgi:hypothetical protein
VPGEGASLEVDLASLRKYDVAWKRAFRVLIAIGIAVLGSEATLLLVGRLSYLVSGGIWLAVGQSTVLGVGITYCLILEAVVVLLRLRPGAVALRADNVGVILMPAGGRMEGHPWKAGPVVFTVRDYTNERRFIESGMSVVPAVRQSNETIFLRFI